MKVLILEENLQLNNEITNFFNANSYETTTLINGFDAIDVIDRDGFDIFIIDINSSNINGYDVIDYIRKTDLYTPIIAISSSSDIDKLIVKYNVKCNEYLKKPFNIKELELRVNSLLNKQSPKIIYFKSDFFYNQNLQQFYFQDQPIKLRYKEKRLCDILINNLG